MERSSQRSGGAPIESRSCPQHLPYPVFVAQLGSIVQGGPWSSSSFSSAATQVCWASQLPGSLIRADFPCHSRKSILESRNTSL